VTTVPPSTSFVPVTEGATAVVANASTVNGAAGILTTALSGKGFTMAEATNELALIGTGVYSKPLPRQNGAPLRLVTPWKYGFKPVKSIVRFTFTDQRPVSFWETIQASEYGFWANVSPEVPHPRWSQASERPLGGQGSVPTLLYNGYGEQVAGLYAGLDGERLFA
jgi:sulfoxide reductase catalytic subunit YedY